MTDCTSANDRRNEASRWQQKSCCGRLGGHAVDVQINGVIRRAHR
jgi:hypothetical protein